MVIITGLTASGKTTVAQQLADNLPATLISADSVQFYRGFDIGSAKPGPREQEQYDYRCLDFLSPEAHFSAGEFVRCAEKHITQAWSQSRLPIIVGGTGLYIRSLLQGIAPIADVPQKVKDDVRALGGEAQEWLYRILKRLDPVWGAKVHAHDRQRILRAWEILWATGEPPSQHWQKGRRGGLKERHDFHLHYWILLPPRELLRRRIEQRTRQMLSKGWLQEVAALLQQGVPPEAMPMKSVGYRQITGKLLECGGDPARAAAQKAQLLLDVNTATWQYAKRQRTWFRRERGLKIARLDRVPRLIQLFCRRTKAT